MGAALHNFKSDCRGAKLSDGKTVGGMWRLTDILIKFRLTMGVQFEITME